MLTHSQDDTSHEILRNAHAFAGRQQPRVLGNCYCNSHDDYSPES